MSEKIYKVCSYCVMDTTDASIQFDEQGVCNYCKSAIKKVEQITFRIEEERERKFNEVIAKVKQAGAGKQYDCIIGLSGGVDSSYLAYIVKKAGLRPLAIHLDNGWNSELAVQNIENIVKKLGIDLFTYVIDWEEFRDLQMAYLKASVLDIEVLSDNAIVVSIFRLMKKYDVKHFLIGTNFAAESIMPLTWMYVPKYDSLNIKSIYKRFGSGRKLKTYPLLSFREYIRYRYFNSENNIPLLNYVPYVKTNALNVLKEEFGWRDYGGKHYESKITQFYQAYILPTKFNVDKRKAHLSSLICSGQITREQALVELEKPLYDLIKLKEDKEYFVKKLDINEKEFEKIMSLPIRPHSYYPSYEGMHKRLAAFKRKLTKSSKKEL
jgi:N-acetyl sugar amidotransferase